MLQETKFKNVEVAGLHSSEDEPDRPGPSVAACGKLGKKALGPFSAAVFTKGLIFSRLLTR